MIHTVLVVTSSLVTYIKNQLESGIEKPQITTILKQSGWKTKDIRSAFGIVKPHAKNHLLVLNIVNLVLILGLIITNIFLFKEIENVKEALTKQNANQNQQISQNYPTSTPVTLSYRIEASPAPIATPSAHLATPIPFKKSEYSIAIYGDSMVDTMGENLEYLQKSLKTKYPTTTFKMYNYGIGAQTVQQGLDRFDSSFNYKTRNYPAINVLKPDVIVIASFAYNPYYPFDKVSYMSKLSLLLDKAMVVTPNTYLLAEIAPLSYDFGKGEGGVPDWSDQARYNHASVIVQQLKAALEVVKLKGIKIINVYDKTNVNGDFGSYSYTETWSGIHPSVTGHTLTANTITETINFDLAN